MLKTWVTLRPVRHFLFYLAILAGICSACLPSPLVFDGAQDMGADADGSSSGAFDAMVDGSANAESDVAVGDGGVVCAANSTRCSETGLPQKCNASRTAYEDQEPCPADRPLCDAATGLCSVPCQAHDQRCK